MMRSLWTGASGMTAQQLNVDTVANNLANVNTTGFKKERLEFKTLLYQTMQRADLDEANPRSRPVNLQVGHGVTPVVSTKTFTTGSFQRTDDPQDVAIEGDGFFVVQIDENGVQREMYTRDGAFKTSIMEDGSTLLTTSDGYPILNTDGEYIILPPEVLMKDVAVDEDGRFSYVDHANNNTFVDLEMQFQMVQFRNPQGLESVGRNLYGITAASGEKLLEAEGETNSSSRLRQNFLEMSNVSVADEMVSLIVAQRAYELNSKVITTSDEMLQSANALKR
ncbi:flagellar basal-body rod protein FlgG [Clostridia bacterium]|nr:flagellar basal-body rod protein FlgG [Clostridia bacterium]